MTFHVVIEYFAELHYLHDNINVDLIHSQNTQYLQAWKVSSSFRLVLNYPNRFWDMFNYIFLNVIQILIFKNLHHLEDL